MNVTTVAPLRYGFHLCASGAWAATLRLDGDVVTLEWWLSDGESFVPQQTEIQLDPAAQLLPIDGTLWVCAARGASHTVARIEPGAQGATPIAVVEGKAARLLKPADGDPDRLPWLLAFDSVKTGLSRVGQARVVALPGAYSGGVWLDRQRLALDHSANGGPASGVEVGHTPQVIFEVTKASNDTIVAARAGLVVVHTDVGGTQRLGFAHDGEPWAFPEELTAPQGLIEAVAIDPTGSRILAHERRGVRSLLHIYDTKTQHHQGVAVPPGTLAGGPLWTEAGLTIPWSAPGTPVVFLDGINVPQLPDAGVSVVSLPGAEGPIEAIAYGGDDWLHRPRLVVALHGGPLGAWQLTHNPDLERLAEDGAAVLAVNLRGSVGYGYAFAAAIRQGWGRADLADLQAIGGHLRAARGTGDGLGLLGQSYGAYLSLLATCTDPGWDFCVAMSPFSGPQRLHECASPSVKRLIERLGGLTAPQDILSVSARAKARILLLHGRFDETIPVAHARELGASFGSGRYLEIEHAGHDLSWPHVWDEVRQFIDEGKEDRHDH